ncbi:MAG: carboxypeptidase-like regulatory domain-containing protein [Candidatus Methanoperedens sp.]|nr:carboxypeptidase-like regulatory domain-containing protein [Candidatus Methanoperedens sp.]MCZ7370293.1 carboxypeptidase-like regulatory domain-containing protein [Candidatus Methanoperedens sp.]
MKIMRDIADRYKRIAAGIAIIAFLAIIYFAMIPGALVASAGVYTTSGVGIKDALVKLVDYPQYNATTAPDGTYTMPNVPIGTYNISASAIGYATNKSQITVTASPPDTIKDFTLSLNAKMVGIIWISSYTGGTITSTMASQLPRPSDIGTEFSGQYDSRKDIAGYYTAILVSDVYGTGANLAINYLYDNGTPYSTANGVVPVNGTFTLAPGDSGLLMGRVVIKSNNPVAAEKRIVSFIPGTWTSRGIMSTLMPERGSAATQFFGQYDSRKDTAGWYTAILVTDVLGTGATLTINYYNDAGTSYGSPVTAVVPVNGTYVLTPGDSGQLLGKVKITSTSPVVAEKRIVYFTPGTWNAYDLMSDSMTKQSDASKELIVPIYDGRKDTLGWYSVVLISDISGTGANVKLDYLYLNGTLYMTTNQPVPVNGTLTIVPGDSGLLYGKMLIHSDNLVVGEERIVNFAPGTWNTRGIMAFNLLKDTDAVKDLVVPQYDSSGEWDAEVVVSAVNGASSPLLNYFNGAGALDHKEYYDIPVNGSYAFYPGDVTMGRLEVGKVTVNG